MTTDQLTAEVARLKAQLTKYQDDVDEARKAAIAAEAERDAARREVERLASAMVEAARQCRIIEDRADDSRDREAAGEIARQLHVVVDLRAIPNPTQWVERRTTERAIAFLRTQARKERDEAEADPECFEEPEAAIALEMAASRLEKELTALLPAEKGAKT